MSKQPDWKVPTVEEARKATRAINEWMAHWDERSKRDPEHAKFLTFPTAMQGCKVSVLRYLHAKPTRTGRSGAIWLAEFDNYALTDMLFHISETGEVSYPDAQIFLHRDLYPEQEEPMLFLEVDDLS